MMTNIEKLEAALRCAKRLVALRKRVMGEVCPTSTASRETLERAVADLIHGVGGELAIINDHLGKVVGSMQRTYHGPKGRRT